MGKFVTHLSVLMSSLAAVTAVSNYVIFGANYDRIGE